MGSDNDFFQTVYLAIGLAALVAGVETCALKTAPQQYVGINSEMISQLADQPTIEATYFGQSNQNTPSIYSVPIEINQNPPYLP